MLTCSFGVRFPVASSSSSTASLTSLIQTCASSNPRHQRLLALRVCTAGAATHWLDSAMPTREHQDHDTHGTPMWRRRDLRPAGVACKVAGSGRTSRDRVSSWLPSRAMCLTTLPTTTLRTMAPARLRLGRTRNVPCTRDTLLNMRVKSYIEVLHCGVLSACSSNPLTA